MRPNEKIVILHQLSNSADDWACESVRREMSSNLTDSWRVPKLQNRRINRYNMVITSKDSKTINFECYL